MDKHRRDSNTPPEAAGPGEAAAFAEARMGFAVRDLVVAGGLRGFTPEQMFPERAA